MIFMAEDMKRKMEEIRKKKQLELESKSKSKQDKFDKKEDEERKRKEREEKKIKKELEHQQELQSKSQEKLKDIEILQQKYEMMELTLIKFQDQILQLSNNILQLSNEKQNIPSNPTSHSISHSYLNSIQLRNWIKKNLQIEAISDDQLSTITKCQKSIYNYNELDARQLELLEMLRRVIRQGKMFDKYLELQKQIQDNE